MKSLFLTIFLSLQTIVFLNSQTCIMSPDFILSSQEEIDNFATDYPGCTQIVNPLTIEEEVPGSITNLEGLSQITYLYQDLIIALNESLTDLSGLENLTHIGGYLHVAFNDNLENVDALQNLIEVGDDITFHFNDKLSSLEGLSGVVSGGEDLLIGGNNQLYDLTGLENLTTIDGRVDIYNNQNLSDISALQNLDPATILSKFPAYPNDLRIVSNPNLSICDYPNICVLLSDPAKQCEINGNAPGCSSIQEVAATCPVIPECTSLINPIDSDLDVLSNVVLEWKPVEDAIGYWVTIGTYPGGHDILDEFDNGPYTTLDFLEFPCGSDIYTTIIPYSSDGHAINCSEEYFRVFGVDNDHCEDAFVLEEPGLNGTTYCADADFSYCALGENSHTVFYLYQNFYDKNVDLELVFTPSTSVSGIAANNLNVGVFKTNCQGDLFEEESQYCDIFEQPIVFTCLPPGEEMLFAVGSQDNMEGDFTIYIDENIHPGNDRCEKISAGNICYLAIEPGQLNSGEVNFTGSMENICPEEDLPYIDETCVFNDQPTLWYKFSVDQSARQISTNITTDGSWTPVWSFFHGENCATLEPLQFTEGPYCLGSIFQSGSISTWLRRDVREYYIAVTYDPMGEPVDDPEFTLNIFSSRGANPENDDPCPGTPNPPIDLTDRWIFQGSTCGAVGYADDPDRDFPNVHCPGETESDAVWFTLTNQKENSDSLVIEVTGEIMGDVVLEIYKGNNDHGCSEEEFLPGIMVDYCGPLPAKLTITEPEFEVIYWIKLGNAQDDCGEYLISVLDYFSVEIANTCNEIGEGQTLGPQTSMDFSEMAFACAEGTLHEANPLVDNGFAGSDCGFLENPTVWYKVETDQYADQLFVTVNTPGTWEPVWTVIVDDCEGSNAADGMITPFCSNGDLTPDLHQTPALPDTDYYVAVTADPQGPQVDYPYFDICAATIRDTLICLGDIDDNCRPDSSTMIKVVNREYAVLEPDVDPDIGYMGPFCAGEKLDIHIEFFYDGTQTGADWLMTIIPDFGPGWNMEMFDPEMNPPTATGSNGGDGEWHVNGTDCSGTVEEYFTQLCTYEDERGILRLCNALCQDCSDCESIGMEEGDELPGGYFWMTDGSNSGCVQNSCRPGEQWGVGSTTSFISWDFSMYVREFNDEVDYFKNKDLQIAFDVLSDGGAGCWEDPLAECNLNRKQMGPLWQVSNGGICNLEPSANDFCTGSITIYPGDTLMGSTLFASNDYFLESCDSAMQINSIWYHFDVPDDDNFERYRVEVLDDRTDYSILLFPFICNIAEWQGNCLGNVYEFDQDSMNTEYYIQISSRTQLTDIPVTINPVVINDDPCPSDPNPPMDLSLTPFHNGNTCFAVGYSDDPTADFPNIACDPATEENAVWYIYTPDEHTDGIEIFVDGNIEGPVTIEVFEGDADMGCQDALNGFLDASCGSLPTNLRIGCIEKDKTIYIKVATTDLDCGGFTISVTNVADCAVANVCEEISDAQTLETYTDWDWAEPWICATGCLDLACPETDTLLFSEEQCDFSKNPTVWYKITTDEIAHQLITKVETNGSWWPIFSIFTGDCDSLVNASRDCSYTCNQLSDSPEQIFTAVDNGPDTLYVAVSADPDGPPIDDPEFTICAITIVNVDCCMGAIDDNCELDPDTHIRIIDRENKELEPDVDTLIGYLGPFCPGEELTVDIGFTYTPESGNDYFHGFIPEFGLGWNTAAFDFEAIQNLPYVTGESPFYGTWHETGSDCGPEIMEFIPHLATYYDDEGNFRLLNYICEYSIWPPDIELGMEPGDPLPSGYFWSQDSDLFSTCVPNSCKPGERLGVQQFSTTVKWTFSMRIREFDDETECLDKNDLSVNFQTFSQGAAGCWEDCYSECLVDRKQFSPDWYVECVELPGVITDTPGTVISSGSIFEALVYTDDGSDYSISVVPIDNPQVMGETDYLFLEGEGVIHDLLILEEGIETTQEVVYMIEVVDTSVVDCHNKLDTVVVTVEPSECVELEITAAQENVLCFGECSGSLSILEIQNGEAPYRYTWSNGEQTESIEELCPGAYTVTIIDNQNCTQIDTFMITEFPQLVLQLTGTNESVEGASDGAVTSGVSGGLPPYTFAWSNGSMEPNIYDLSAGDYELTVTDANGCTISESISIITEGTHAGIISMDKILVYPVPATDKILVDCRAVESVPKAISVFNTDGKKMELSILPDRLTELATDRWREGVYFLQLDIEGELVYRKIIIIR